MTRHICCALVVAAIAITRAAEPVREVAVTFDDLPVAGVLRRDVPASRELTAKLLKAIAAHRVPAIGFVNENKLASEGRTTQAAPDEARVALLRMWLDAGLELGNHSYSHPDLNVTPLETFEDDVLKGEAVLRPLLKARGLTPRFFRHPFLHTGRDLETRARFELFLTNRGYRVAPVTIDNDEYIFAAAYDRASVRGDAGLMRQVAAAYVPYMEAKFAYFERNSVDLFGREMRQVLLVHANALNADCFDPLAQMIERRGYRFITIERALEDPAFRSPDTYTGTGGITWIHRWALTRRMGREFFAGEPDVPVFVAKAAQP